jgi:hypothetical protein
MKRLQKHLRAIIAAGSIVGFLAGWGLLAHAGKPVAVSALPAITAPAPSFDPGPLPSINSGPTNLQPLPSLPSVPSMPRLRLRTGGS